jgi:hypothetical protein
MPDGLVRRALLFSTYNHRSRNEAKTGRVGKVYFLFGFSGLGVFSTGAGLDKGWRGAPGVVQKPVGPPFAQEARKGWSRSTMDSDDKFVEEKADPLRG